MGPWMGTSDDIAGMRTRRRCGVMDAIPIGSYHPVQVVPLMQTVQTIQTVHTVHTVQAI